MSHSFRYKEKRSRTQARKLILTMAMYGDHGYQLQYHLSYEESVKEFFRQHGYNFEVVVEEVRNRLAWVPIIDVRTPSSFTLGGAPGSIAGIKRGGDEFLVKFEGEMGNVVLSEYVDIFEHAVEELDRSLERSSNRDFLTAVSDGIASIEAYINYQANRIGGQQYRDSKQELISFDDKLDKWIPQITGGKLDKGGVNWNHHKQLRGIRDDFQAHPKRHLYGISYPEICRRINLFRTGIAGLLFDLHLVFNDLVPSPITHGYFLPDIHCVIEPGYS